MPLIVVIEPTEPIGTRMRNIRIANETRQKQVACVLDISPQRLHRYEQNAYKPPFELLDTFAKYFNVPHDELTKGLTNGNK